MRVSTAAIFVRSLFYRFRAWGLLLLWPLLWLYRLRYRHVNMLREAPMPEADPLPLEGYTNRLWYQPGQTINFFLKADQPDNQLVIERFVSIGKHEQVLTQPFGQITQPLPDDATQHGCGWAPGLEVPVDARFVQGYYRAKLLNNAGEPVSYICFLIGPAKPTSRIAVVAPVCTWLAYNPYGGKSLYHNQLNREPVYFASSLRPNPGLQFNPFDNLHAWEIEAGIFTWLNYTFGADLYPDYQLENPHELSSYQLLALAYHCEYVSAKMHSGLRQLVYKKQKSLLAIGGNQIYWQIRWHPQESRIECRKDATRFSDGSGHGSTWSKTAYPEDELLGCRFTNPGTGTYAPYTVTDPHHWLYTGCDVKEGDLFGERGASELPICGDETDKSTWISRFTTQVIARGLNKAAIGRYDIYGPASGEWDGEAGGEIALTPFSEHHAVLHTGSIQSGSGLGTDKVFSAIVRNFLDRYLTTSATGAEDPDPAGN